MEKRFITIPDLSQMILLESKELNKLVDEHGTIIKTEWGEIRISHKQSILESCKSLRRHITELAKEIKQTQGRI